MNRTDMNKQVKGYRTGKKVEKLTPDVAVGRPVTPTTEAALREEHFRGKPMTSPVQPPKPMINEMVEAASAAKKRGDKKLPKGVEKSIKKLVRRSSVQPGHSAFPDEMPESVRMNKMNRGKIQEALGKSMLGKPMKKGGKVKKPKKIRGAGIAKKGVRKARYI